MSCDPTPYPVPARRPVERSFHGHIFHDPYEWMREKDSPELRAHLNAENAYTEAQAAHLQPLREQIYGEIKNRTQESDMSVPSRHGQWWYFARTVEGGAHQVFCRVPAQPIFNSTDEVVFAADISANGHVTDALTDRRGDDAAWTPPQVEPGIQLPGEEVLLDANAASEGHEFYALGAFSVAEDGTRVLWAEDTEGDERFTLYVRDLTTGEVLPDRIQQASYGAFLTPDATTVIYTVVDESWRPWRVYSHVIGTPTDQDQLLYQEDDPGLWLGAELSADKQWLMLSSFCSEYGEYRMRPVKDPSAPWQIVLPRADKVLYDVEPLSIAGTDYLLLTHHYKAPNGRVSLMPATQAGCSVEDVNFVEVVAASETERVESCTPTATHLVISVRASTTPRVRLIPRAGLGALVAEGAASSTAIGIRSTEVNFDEELFTAVPVSAEYENPVVRISYRSWVTPARIYDVPTAAPATPGVDEFGAGEPILRREAAVLGGYNPLDYTVERDWTTASDGTEIPVTLIRRADLDPSEPAPVVQYAYGSYEHSIDPAFSISRLSLLDRGVVWAVAHVRGGGEMGRAWYEDGKKLAKKNTFTDFVDVTRHLGARPDIDEHRIALMGGSAGGLLAGAVLNLAPELYCAALAAVPFVDPLTSILMPELPLTALEWEEWGNPIADPEIYAYMRSYSPYENLRHTAYPPVLAVTSLNDTRVLYVEPAKWVAALREHTSNPESVLLRCEMAGGHGGASGRYSQWKDTAWEYAWLAEKLGAARG